MCDVTIVCNSTCKGRIGPGAYCFVMIYKNHKREVVQCLELTTPHHTQLTCIIDALERLKFPCNVKIVSKGCYIYNNLHRWQKLGEAKEAWTKLEQLTAVHNVLFEKPDANTQAMFDHTAEVAERKKNFVCLRNAGFNTL